MLRFKAVPGQDPDVLVVMRLCSVGDGRQRDKIDVLTFGGARSITRKYFSGRVGEDTVVSIKNTTNTRTAVILPFTFIAH